MYMAEDILLHRRLTGESHPECLGDRDESHLFVLEMPSNHTDSALQVRNHHCGKCYMFKKWKKAPLHSAVNILWAKDTELIF